MATFTQIVNLRLEISDPYGVINLLSVASKSNLPKEPIPQTAYKVLTDNAYYKSDIEIDAGITDYYRIELQLSDSRISDMIDLYGEKKAVRIALLAILKRLGTQFPIVRSQSGAESTQYQSLLDLYRFYKGLADDAAEQEAIDTGNNSGRWFKMKQPRIGGGNL
jgi:hypothetical protein